MEVTGLALSILFCGVYRTPPSHLFRFPEASIKLCDVNEFSILCQPPLERRVALGDLVVAYRHADGTPAA